MDISNTCVVTPSKHFLPKDEFQFRNDFSGCLRSTTGLLQILALTIAKSGIRETLFESVRPWPSSAVNCLKGIRHCVSDYYFTNMERSEQRC